jgi:hypothetical protein
VGAPADPPAPGAIADPESVPQPRPSTDTAPGGRYADFKILIDGPAGPPGLDFDADASALAEIIMASRAEFALGIYGPWGSGKTTLMQAIRDRLDGRPDSVLTVWFTAWRYEKEPHLLIPLVDVLREALDERARDDADGHTSAWSSAAAAVGRAGRALLAGLKLSAGVSGFQAEIDFGEVTGAMREGGRDASGPLSAYHSGFVMLRTAIEGLSANGTRRVVIFVDDLDRCLAPNALQVLESMKLFFDVQGCVFVVGLDPGMAEKAVAARYGADGETGTSLDTIGRRYLQKIFQLVFALPVIGPARLGDCLGVIAEGSGWTDQQRADFYDNVCPLLRAAQPDRPVYLRPLKALVNSYVLQVKVLAARLGDALEPSVVCGLLAMSYHPDWQQLYDQLGLDPPQFQLAMRNLVEGDGDPAEVWLSGTKFALPAGLYDFLREPASLILTVPDLGSYVMAAEVTLTAERWVLDARMIVNQVRDLYDKVSRGLESRHGDTVRSMTGAINRLYVLILEHPQPYGRLRVLYEQLESAVSRLKNATERPDGADGPDVASDWLTDVQAPLDEVDAALHEYRRYARISGYS